MLTKWATFLKSGSPVTRTAECSKAQAKAKQSAYEMGYSALSSAALKTSDSGTFEFLTFSKFRHNKNSRLQASIVQNWQLFKGLGIMRKNSTTAKLTEYEIKRNKKISKSRYIVEQYFGLSHLHDRASRARFTDIAKNKFDAWYRQAAFNIARGLKILRVATV